MEDRWLSVDEIGAYLGIKRDTVYKWIAEKQMPAHRMGRLWKFRKEEVDKIAGRSPGSFFFFASQGSMLYDWVFPG